MNPFTYVRAANSDDAIATLTREPQAMFIAGGTNILDLMKEGVHTPSQLVDIRKLPSTEIVTKDNGGIRIGATLRNSDAAYNSLVQERYPVLSEAILAGASAQLRNMATVGGNLMQRTRCSYFHDTAFACNKRQPGSGCAALEGFNRMHAVLGTSEHCIAAHPSDMCVALVALDAVVQTQGPRGERSIPITDFHLLPGETPHLETVLEHGEIITAVDLPEMPLAWRSHYLKIRDRASYAFALVSAAVVLEIDEEVIRNARIALGGVGTKPWRSLEAEQVLVGAPATQETFTAAADAAMQEARPYRHNQFKIELAKRTLEEALKTVAAISGGQA
ncbi:xanthine dehydrogenase family protein subunit M [Brasilonema octagenarum UFV-E1]|uniref:Xanthine dehydrogenase family protein subunit M n=1 Tax=Brasilonema sennae CENA114 TaxID=415709 RepID=A0A856M993_9CYAN|nr:xanthine dehydrogenase family protein subunit M [Brasilonema sennae]QDL07328.1 xanthine dehydrogenase family protein subunit M [Brasilonema sennae CENA114]QDL13692.1 xanthine dehydrogenase family protein subunit M [Brasilonema octagenarum UFV-E1]